MRAESLEVTQVRDRVLSLEVTEVRNGVLSLYCSALISKGERAVRKHSCDPSGGRKRSVLESKRNGRLVKVETAVDV